MSTTPAVVPVRFLGPAAGISDVLKQYFPHTWLVLVLPRIAAADLLSAGMEDH